MSILSTADLEFNVGLEFSFSNLSFDNIEFTSKGYLMELSHQLPTNLTISDSSFTNIQAGSILIVSSNLQNTQLTSNVHILNSEMNYIGEKSTSFINLKEGGRLFINSCNFTNLHTLRNGAVISAGFQKTKTVIYDSIFQNNTAKDGGVFSITEESVIKCYNCTLNNNFAITSGVVNVGQSGQSEFYGSRIFNNYANNNPVSLIFNTALDSIYDHTEVYSNRGLKRSEIITEFGASCSKL